MRSDRFLCEWPECGRSFAKAAKLTEHIRTHTGERPFACEQCEAKFSRQSHLDRHTLSKHERRREFACSLCPATFTLPHHLTRHQRIHQNTGFTCTLCDSQFGKKADLNRHLLTVHQQSPHTCADCGKGFTMASRLERHRQRAHSKTYLCGRDGCTQVFQQWSLLCQHLRTQHPSTPVAKKSDDGKKHGCSLCEKYFSRKSALSLHHRTVHLNLRPYQCKVCSSEFGHKHLLTRHQSKCQ